MAEEIAGEGDEAPRVLRTRDRMYGKYEKEAKERDTQQENGSGELVKGRPDKTDNEHKEGSSREGPVG